MAANKCTRSDVVLLPLQVADEDGDKDSQMITSTVIKSAAPMASGKMEAGSALIDISRLMIVDDDDVVVPTTTTPAAATPKRACCRRRKRSDQTSSSNQQQQQQQQQQQMPQPSLYPSPLQKQSNATNGKYIPPVRHLMTDDGKLYETDIDSALEYIRKKLLAPQLETINSLTPGERGIASKLTHIIAQLEDVRSRMEDMTTWYEQMKLCFCSGLANIQLSAPVINEAPTTPFAASFKERLGSLVTEDERRDYLIKAKQTAVSANERNSVISPPNTTTASVSTSTTTAASSNALIPLVVAEDDEDDGGGEEEDGDGDGEYEEDDNNIARTTDTMETVD